MDDIIKNSDFFQQLSEETKEKLKHCNSEEEAMEILKQDMVPIPDDALNDVAGGDIVWSICETFKPGDSRKDVSSGHMAEDFEEGRITGSDFF